MAEKKDKKPKRKHLHQIRSVFAHDGSVAHFHSYKNDPNDDSTEPERLAGTSDDADEAGQHVADNFAQNQSGADPGAAQPEEDAQPEEATMGQE